MADEYFEFATKKECDDYLAAEGYPKRGRNAKTGQAADDSKQKTERPYPIEEDGDKRIMKTDGKLTRPSTARKMTKTNVQLRGRFLDPVIEKIR